MALTPPPPAPDINDPDTFEARAQAWVVWAATFVSELNAILGITIPAGSAAASTLTGNTLAANVLNSSLTSLGTIASLAATAAAVSGALMAGTFKTDAQTTNCANGVATTLFNPGTTPGRYDVFAYIAGVGSANYTASATFLYEGSDARGPVNDAPGALLVLSRSGTSIQVTQTSGGAADVVWSYVRIR